ncbi:MAG: glycosyltransferase family 2 protein [Myxococcota bacterium]|jgi:glycosyltransferase involved in cell wall biosynthesis|nr:glycosyltransferase family 2 protein [Myxococcota bacterium]
MTVDVIIPALNEEKALAAVLSALSHTAVRRVIVVDNGSTDNTAKVARLGGAKVVSEPRRGYGQAMSTGIESVRDDPPQVVAFLDGDGADDPSFLPALLEPVLRGEADLVLGSRMRGRREQGSMSPAQVVGNHVVPFLLRRLFGARCTDIGPMRVIRYDALRRLDLQDRGMGFTVEMQIRAALLGLRVMEVAVPYRRRIGRSKISGTVRGTVRATVGILAVITRHLWAHNRRL